MCATVTVPPPPLGVHVALQVPALVAYQQRLLHGVADYVRDRGLATWWRVDYHPYVLEFDDVPDGCDGVIRQVEGEAAGRDLLGRGLRVVGVLGRRYDDPDLRARVPHVHGDDDAVGRMAAEHLLERGLRSLRFLGLDRESRAMRARREGFAARVAEAGHECPVTPVSDHRYRDWAAALPRPVGVMAYNDIEARALVNACGELGLRVPDDVAVVGVDDDPLLCAFSNPPLSSVVTGTRRMGYLAAGLLDRMLRGEEDRPPDPPPVPPLGVITRQSSDVLAVEDEDVAAAVRYIRENACGPGGLTVEQVARRAVVGRRRLEQKFRRALGLTPLAEIRRVRMNRAAELLAGTSLSVGEVAARCGYSAQSRFGADFRATWGQTPLRYRRGRRTPMQ